MQQGKRWELFECQRCGRCCNKHGLPHDIYNDGERFSEIAQFLKLTVEQVIEKYYGRITEDGEHWESEDHKRTPCPFLRLEAGNKTTCIIYEVRPRGCRLYPFDTGRGGVDCPGARIAHERFFRKTGRTGPAP